MARWESGLARCRSSPFCQVFACRSFKFQLVLQGETPWEEEKWKGCWSVLDLFVGKVGWEWDSQNETVIFKQASVMVYTTPAGHSSRHWTGFVVRVFMNAVGMCLWMGVKTTRTASINFWSSYGIETIICAHDSVWMGFKNKYFFRFNDQCNAIQNHLFTVYVDEVLHRLQNKCIKNK